MPDAPVHENPDFYRGGAYARGMHEFWIAALRRFYRELPAGHRLLDVGAGSGDLVAWAREDGRDASGVEPYWPTLGPGVVRGFGEDLPQEDASVDLITCFSVLQDVADPARCLSEVSRVLKPDGAAVIAVPLAYPLMLHPYKNAPGHLLSAASPGLVERDRRYVGVRYVVPLFKRTLARWSVAASRMAGDAYFRQYSRALADMAVVTYAKGTRRGPQRAVHAHVGAAAEPPTP